MRYTVVSHPTIDPLLLQLPTIVDGTVALMLLYQESTLTEDGLGDTLTAFHRRCLDVIKNNSTFEWLNHSDTLFWAQKVLHREYPKELWSGPFEIISDCLAAQQATKEVDDDSPSKDQATEDNADDNMEENDADADAEGNEQEGAAPNGAQDAVMEDVEGGAVAAEAPAVNMEEDAEEAPAPVAQDDAMDREEAVQI